MPPQGRMTQEEDKMAKRLDTGCPESGLSERKDTVGSMEGDEQEGGSWARILIVDDDRTLLEVLSGILSTMGFDVSVANGSHQALTMFFSDSFDLVFTDLNMPGMDGWSLASRIKAKSPHTPVVLITGEMEEDVKGRLRESCVDHALFKPFKLGEIISTAHRFLEKRAEKRISETYSPCLPS
jgi:DNA-binding response OmpR family regulator